MTGCCHQYGEEEVSVTFERGWFFVTMRSVSLHEYWGVDPLQYGSHGSHSVWGGWNPFNMGNRVPWTWFPFNIGAWVPVSTGGMGPLPNFWERESQSLWEAPEVA